MTHGSLFVLVILLGGGSLTVALVHSKRRVREAKSRSLWDYFLFWPLILEQPARRERVESGGHFFTIPELVATAVLGVVLLIASVLLTCARRQATFLPPN